MASPSRWFCSQCGAPNPANLMACYACSAPLIQAPAPTPPQAPTPASAVAPVAPVVPPAQPARMGMIYFLLAAIVVLLAVIVLRPYAEGFLQAREKEKDRAAIIKVATADCESMYVGLSSQFANSTPGKSKFADEFLKTGTWEVSFRTSTQAEAILNVPSMGGLPGFQRNYEKRDTGWVCTDCE